MGDGLQEETIQPSETVSKLFKSRLEKLLEGQSLQAYHQGFVQAQGQAPSLPARAVAAELNILLQLESKQTALDTLLKAGIDTSGNCALCLHIILLTETPEAGNTEQSYGLLASIVLFKMPGAHLKGL